MENNDAEYLMISGLEHFTFCRRQWALIHVEQLWQENALTLSGQYLHERVHDAGFTELRGSTLLSRAMPVRSETMRVTGQCDLVELHRSPEGVPICGREGRWQIYPVEYKHGKPSECGSEQMQLCAQAMCLEEMFVTEISEGAIYYGAMHHRQKVMLTEELRRRVRESFAEMHRLFERGYTPKVKMTSACKSCSLAELCQPVLSKRMSASEYVRRALETEE